MARTIRSTPQSLMESPERAGLEDGVVGLPVPTLEGAARMRALAQELAALGTPTWPPEPGVARHELGDGLGLERDIG